MFDFFVMKYFVALALLIGWTCLSRKYLSLYLVIFPVIEEVCVRFSFMILKYLSFDPASIFSLRTFKLIFDKREQNTNKVGSQKSRILFSFSKSNLKFSYSRLFLGGVFPLTLSNVAIKQLMYVYI